MDRQDALAYRDALVSKLTEFRAAKVPVIWVAIAAGGSKLLIPETGACENVRDVSVLEDIGFSDKLQTHINPGRDNKDIYNEFIHTYGPRENEVLYRKPAMSALVTPDDIRDMERILEQNGRKLTSKKNADDHKETIYLQEEDQHAEFIKLFGDDLTLYEYLKQKKVTDTYIFGTVAKYCVAETAITSASKGFNTNILSNLVLSWSYPVTADSRIAGQLVWGGFSHENAMQNTLREALADKSRGFADDERRRVSEINFIGNDQKSRRPVYAMELTKTPSLMDIAPQIFADKGNTTNQPIKTLVGTASAAQVTEGFGGNAYRLEP